MSGPRERILFVCTANRDRSRTAEEIYAGDPRYEVQSAGLAPFAVRPVDRDLLRWADRVFVMDEEGEAHHTQIRLRFPDVKPHVIDLRVPCRWEKGDPALARILKKRLAPHLGTPGGARRS